MYEFLLQEAYAEWIIPLTIVAIWILRWQLLLLARPVTSNRKFNPYFQVDVRIEPQVSMGRPLQPHVQLLRSVKRKECPDDSEEDHSHSI